MNYTYYLGLPSIQFSPLFSVKKSFVIIIERSRNEGYHVSGKNLVTYSHYYFAGHESEERLGIISIFEMLLWRRTSAKHGDLS